MKVTVKIEEVRVGDKLDGKRVVEALHRRSVRFVRLILEGGWPIEQGYEGKLVTIERDEKGSG